MTKSTDGLFAEALKAKQAEATEPVNQAAADETVEESEPEPEADVQAPDDEDEEPKAPSELDMLKSRARVMGIRFSNNISVAALKAKIDAKLEGESQEEGDDEETKNEEEEEVVVAKAPAQAPAVISKATARKNKRSEMIKKQMKLVRVRITNLNPSKKDLPGEIFTFANSILGAVKKYVPYGEATENGYHIPYCIYTQLKEREFVNIKTRKDSRGRTIVENNMAREFALEVLPQLTETELARLAAAQAAAKGMD